MSKQTPGPLTYQEVCKSGWTAIRSQHHPRIESAKPLPRRRLLVRFQNGESRVFDCNPLLSDLAFALLHNDSLFKAVRVDAGGYGISWTDEIDLSESEIWIKGTKPVGKRLIRG